MDRLSSLSIPWVWANIPEWYNNMWLLVVSLLHIIGPLFHNKYNFYTGKDGSVLATTLKKLIKFLKEISFFFDID